MSLTAVAGVGLTLLGGYSTLRVRRDRAARARALAAMSQAEGEIKGHRHSVASGSDGLGDSDHFVPIVEYEVGARRYQIELPDRAGFRPGPLGAPVRLAFDPADPASAQPVEPRDRYAMQVSVAVFLGGLAMTAAALLEVLRPW